MTYSGILIAPAIIGWFAEAIGPPPPAHRRIDLPQCPYPDRVRKEFVPRQRAAPPQAPATPVSRVARRCAAMVESRAFGVVIVLVIGANAVVLGLETYPH